MAEKKKLVGRIAHAPDRSKSQIYWKCPARGCTEIHYFLLVPQIIGATAIYQKKCNSCSSSYIANQLNVVGTTVLLAAVFDGEKE